MQVESQEVLPSPEAARSASVHKRLTVRVIDGQLNVRFTHEGGGQRVIHAVGLTNRMELMS